MQWVWICLTMIINIFACDILEYFCQSYSLDVQLNACVCAIKDFDNMCIYSPASIVLYYQTSFLLVCVLLVLFGLKWTGEKDHRRVIVVGQMAVRHSYKGQCVVIYIFCLCFVLFCIVCLWEPNVLDLSSSLL